MKNYGCMHWTSFKYLIRTTEVIRAIINSLKINDKLNKLDCCRDTPLIKAAKFGNSLFIKLLLEAGALVDVKNFENKTVLDCMDKIQDPLLREKILQKYNEECKNYSSNETVILKKNINPLKQYLKRKSKKK